MIADLTKGEALIKCSNSLAYDAVTFGNHEPDFGMDVLKERVESVKFPFVAANLADGATGKPFAKPYVIRQAGGVQVGILGLAYPKTPWTTSKKNIQGMTFEDPIAAAKRELPHVKAAGAELVAVLSHLGLSGDQQLAQQVSSIDVIVGGHSHNRMESALRVGETLIVQAGAHGSDLGRLDLRLENGKVASQSHSLIVLDHQSLLADDEMERLVEATMRPFARELGEQVGEGADWLARAQTIAGQDARKRDEESPVDSLFADIVRETLAADICFLPGV